MQAIDFARRSILVTTTPAVSPRFHGATTYLIARYTVIHAHTGDAIDICSSWGTGVYAYSRDRRCWYTVPLVVFQGDRPDQLWATPVYLSSDYSAHEN